MATIFRVTFSGEDGDQTREYDNLFAATEYAKDFREGFAHWSHRHFNQVKSDDFLFLWETRKKEFLKIEEIFDDVDDNPDNELTPLQQFAQNEMIEYVDGDYEALENDILENNLQVDDAKEIDEWFLERAKYFEFHSLAYYCSMCQERRAYYNGITLPYAFADGKVVNGTAFQFCTICRDRLVQHASYQKSHPECIGA